MERLEKQSFQVSAPAGFAEKLATEWKSLGERAAVADGKALPSSSAGLHVIALPPVLPGTLALSART